MKNLKYSTFDLFAYSLPGLIIVLSLLFTFRSEEICKSGLIIPLSLKKDLNIYILSIIIISSYIIGYISNLIGGYYLKLAEQIWPPPSPLHSGIPESQKYILVREFSPGNFEYIEKWNTLKNMCSNLSFAMLFSGVLLHFNMSCMAWYLLAVFIGLSLLLVFQSKKYHSWSIIDLDNCVSLLDLENKSKELFEKKIIK